MANTLLNLIQTYLLPQVLPVLRESLQMPALIRRDLDDAAKKRATRFVFLCRKTWGLLKT